MYLVVDEVDELHRELLQSNVAIEKASTDQTRSNRGMDVRDSDRNMIAFVQPMEP